MAKKLKTPYLLAALILLTIATARADSLDSLQWSAATFVNAGNGDFAPLYMAANRYGTLTQAPAPTKP